MEDDREEKIRYNGGSRKCLLAREGMRVEELRGMVREIVERVWYSLKDNRNMVMTVERDTNMRMMFKGNDEHGYLYVGDKDILVWRVSKGEGATAGETGC